MIGGEREAKAWLVSEKGIPEGLPVQDIAERSFTSRALSGQLGLIVLDLWKTLISQSVSLDGPQAVWQRSGS